MTGGVKSLGVVLLTLWFSMAAAQVRKSKPTQMPTPTLEPTIPNHPTPWPTLVPIPFPTPNPSPVPTPKPTKSNPPTSAPTGFPTHLPTTLQPSNLPVPMPSMLPFPVPSVPPSAMPTGMPSLMPSSQPSVTPLPSGMPTPAPTHVPWFHWWSQLSFIYFKLILIGAALIFLCLGCFGGAWAEKIRCRTKRGAALFDAIVGNHGNAIRLEIKKRREEKRRRRNGGDIESSEPLLYDFDDEGSEYSEPATVDHGIPEYGTISRIPVDSGVSSRGGVSGLDASLATVRIAEQGAQDTSQRTPPPERSKLSKWFGIKGWSSKKKNPKK